MLSNDNDDDSFSVGHPFQSMTSFVKYNQCNLAHVVLILYATSTVL